MQVLRIDSWSSGAMCPQTLMLPFNAVCFNSLFKPYVSMKDHLTLHFLITTKGQKHRTNILYPPDAKPWRTPGVTHKIFSISSQALLFKLAQFSKQTNQNKKKLANHLNKMQ
jgi:hypothetical protein